MGRSDKTTVKSNKKIREKTRLDKRRCEIWFGFSIGFAVYCFCWRWFNFTYEDIVKRVQSIDVFWFNERKFPACVFEIEHSTDFRNALIKFLELQDFNVEMYIVSPKERQREFFHKIEFSSFKPIKSRTKFISYEEISHWHSKTYELMLAENKIFEIKNQ